MERYTQRDSEMVKDSTGEWVRFNEAIDRFARMIKITDNICSRMNDRIAELEARELEQWIPVTERLPEKEGEYLCKTKNTCIVLYYRNGFYYDDSRITHWRELPKFEDKNED